MSRVHLRDSPACLCVQTLPTSTPFSPWAETDKEVCRRSERGPSLGAPLARSGGLQGQTPRRVHLRGFSFPERRWLPSSAAEGTVLLAGDHRGSSELSCWTGERAGCPHPSPCLPQAQRYGGSSWMSGWRAVREGGATGALATSPALCGIQTASNLRGSFPSVTENTLNAQNP